MYIPKHFAEEDQDRLHRLIRSYPFATLFTWHEPVPTVTHLPFILDTTRGKQGTLLAHLARKNPQSQEIAAGGEALAIFQGPHTYISPSWYAGDSNVPTWNFTAVHAYGYPRVIADATDVRRILDAQTAAYEAHQPVPWEIPWSDERTHQMLAGIVAFEMVITRLEGKFKLNQNKTEADRQGVMQALSASDRQADHSVASMMAERRSGSQP